MGKEAGVLQTDLEKGWLWVGEALPGKAMPSEGLVGRRWQEEWQGRGGKDIGKGQPRRTKWFLIFEISDSFEILMLPTYLIPKTD